MLGLVLIFITFVACEVNLEMLQEGDVAQNNPSIKEFHFKFLGLIPKVLYRLGYVQFPPN
jgi:hypothetical protein